ncbi:MAG: penicillin-binding transpeptidase domain-containing protein [Angelakisella sp.]|nr:penicillin-binding transpeptidase domain-containing protein [Angelakisella sp.]
MKKKEFARLLVLGGVVGLALMLFIYQLMLLQISQGEYYKSKATAGSVTTQTVVAARGEIVDRYGRPFTVNRASYDIILDQTFLPYGNKANPVLNDLIVLMESLGQDWIDNLPITKEEPFEFLEGYDTEVARLKKYLNVNEYATAEDCIHWLSDPKFFDLGEYDTAAMRKLAGVRYEMVRRDFSLANSYTFAQDVGVIVSTNVKERSYMLPGVDVVQSTRREFISGALAPHIIGTIGPIYAEEMTELKEQGKMWSQANKQGYKGNESIGKSGIEKKYETELRGQNGERRITLNAQGEVIKDEISVEPVPGNTVVLTLDRDLQQVAQDALQAQILNLQKTAPEGEGREADAGAVVAIKVGTGEVLAAATYPNYDASTYNKDFPELSKMTVSPYTNRALMGEYAAGSIYKPSVSIAGLAEGLIGEDSIITCGGAYFGFGPSYQPKCLGVHGARNVKTALQVSCNVFYYELGMRLGIDNINKYSAHFGLGSPTGIEITEASGQLSSPATREAAGDQWRPSYTAQSAIGQLDNKFTPIQMANYVATLANNGTRMQAHLVNSIKSYDFSKTIYETPIQEVDQVPASAEAFRIVRDGMIMATSAGGTSGWHWTGFPLTVASKTGTPETHDLPNSTYICYVPAEDPQIAIAVVIEKGWHGYTGAPVARAIAEEYFFGTDDAEDVVTPGQLLP